MLTFRTVEIYLPEAAARHNLRFSAMTGWEGLGQPFWYNVELLATDGNIDKLELLGQSMTVAMLADEPGATPRFWNGVIESFTQTSWRGDFFTYHARLCPRLAMLSRKTDSRIFQASSLGGQGKTITVLDILKSVFDEHHLNVAFDKLTPTAGRWNDREYVVQYQESDLDFVHRLMERESIYYYFRHDNGHHQMVLANDTGEFYREGSAYARIPYYPPNEGGSDRRGRDHVDSWQTGMRVQPGQFTGKDFDFEAPTAPRISTARAPKGHSHHATYEVYEYPAGYPKDVGAEDGPRGRYAERRLEEQQGDHEQAFGTGTARGLLPGAAFGLVGYPGEPEDRVFLVTWAEYAVATNAYASGDGAGGDAGADYRVRFAALDVKLQFRPRVRAPRPTVKGPQTAIVVGTPGSEITTDQYGRVKVKFHWDRAEGRDHNSSCFVRVAQIWAGAKWGAMFMPRVGHEVIVDFLEGDPDQPIIVGRVYNGDRMPPYDPEAHPTVSTIKSMTSPDGGGFNELRFEDRKDNEQLFLHAQRRMDVRVQASLYETVGASRQERIGDHGAGDLVRLVAGSVHEHAKGDHIELVDKRLHHNVKGEVIEVFEADQTTAVTGRQTATAKEIAAEATQTISLKGGKVIAQAGQALSLKGGDVKIEATQSLSLKVGGNFVVLTPAGVYINGVMVMINSGGGAQPADAPLTVRDPTIESPVEPQPADSALPGEHVEAGGPASRPDSRAVSLHRAPEPPLLPAAPEVRSAKPATAAPLGPGAREFVEIKWVEMDTYCGGPATLQGSTRGYPDGSSEYAHVRNVIDGATVVATTVAIRGDAFYQAIAVKDWLPRRVGTDFETFRDEIAVSCGKKTPRPLRMKFIPGLAPAACTLVSTMGVDAQFEMSVKNYQCVIDTEIRYVKGRMAWLIQLGDDAPRGAGGQTGVDWGPADENKFSGRDWRFAKGDPKSRSLKFWDGGDWQPLPPTWRDPRNTRLYGIGIWREGLINKAQFGNEWPEAIPFWSEAEEQDAQRTFAAWKAHTKTTWSNKFDLRRDACSSANQSCCRYAVQVSIKEFAALDERTDGHVIVVGVSRGRSNAKAWSLADRRPGLAPHEFGHHLGNPDEYPHGVGIDASVNSDGAVAGIDQGCLMGSVPDEGIPPIKARHFNIIKRHLAVMMQAQKGVVWTFHAVPHS